MKKQYISIFLFILIGCFNVQAQEVENKNKAIKLYSNFHILNSDEASVFRLRDSSGFHFHNLSVAFSKNKKESKRFIEAELSFLYRDVDGDFFLKERTIDTTTTPATVIESGKFIPVNANDIVIGFRFELGRWWKSFNEEKIKLGWSPAFRAYAHFSEMTPKTTESFPESRFQAYLKLGFVPRIQYHLNSNLFLDLNFPIEILSAGVDFLTIENPILTDRQKKQGGGDFSVGGEVLMRLGVGYRF